LLKDADRCSAGVNPDWPISIKQTGEEEARSQVCTSEVKPAAIKIHDDTLRRLYVVLLRSARCTVLMPVLLQDCH
jgi:hypothetical protein